METNAKEIGANLNEKIQKIRDLDSNLKELLKETNPDKELKARLLEIQNKQTNVTQSFDVLQTKLDDYNKMKQNVAGTVIRFQIFVHEYIKNVKGLKNPFVDNQFHIFSLRVWQN